MSHETDYNTKGRTVVLDPHDNIVHRVEYKERSRKLRGIFPFYFMMMMMSVGLVCVLEFYEPLAYQWRKNGEYISLASIVKSATIIKQLENS